MNTVQLLATVLGALGGVGGVASYLRAKAQNRLDEASSRKAGAEAESIAVDTARDLIAQVREEMDRRVHDLSKEVSRLEGRLEGALAQRDRFREEAENLHRENRDLRDRVAVLESRVAEVTEALVRERARRRTLETRYGVVPADDVD